MKRSKKMRRRKKRMRARDLHRSQYKMSCLTDDDQYVDFEYNSMKRYLYFPTLNDLVSAIS
jgi:hypothetical protein